MRVVFFGTPAPAVPTLRTLVEAGHEVVRVVTRPDRPIGRSRRPVPPPVKTAALELGLDVVQPRSVKRPPLAPDVAGLRADVAVVVAYGRILPPALLEATPHGAINVHFSLLPAYRGAAPVQWALARCEATTGVTTMQLDEGLDTGDVLLARDVRIEPGEHAPALAARLAGFGADLLRETLDALADGVLEPVAQDPVRATHAPILEKADGEIDPSLPARAIEGRVRGFDPWPGVWLSRGGVRVRLLEARALPDERAGAPPGTVLGLGDGAVRIACGEDTVLGVGRIQASGRKAADARDAINGRQLVPGDRLTAIPS